MNIIDDPRPIVGVYYGNDSGYTVGHAGITAIKVDIDSEKQTPSLTSLLIRDMLPRWFIIYKGDVIISRINMSNVSEVVYVKI